MSRRPCAVAALLVALLCSARMARAGVIEVVCRSREARRGEVVAWVDSIPEKVERRLTGQGNRWPWSRAVVRSLPVLEATRSGLRPRLVTAVAGDTLRFRNRDVVWHGLFSVSPVAPFDLGKRAPGADARTRLPRPGSFTVRCDIHGEESATVLVLANHAWARSDSTGTVRLPDLPAGRYTVRMLRADGRQLQRTVELRGRSTPVRVPL